MSRLFPKREWQRDYKKTYALRGGLIHPQIGLTAT